MKIYDRSEKKYRETEQYGQNKLQFLYGNVWGRCLLKLVITPAASKLYGQYQKLPISAKKIPRFIEEYHIHTEDFEDREYPSFHSFFIRKLRPGARMIDPRPCSLISPADAKLLVYDITDDLTVFVKGRRYTLSQLTGGKVDISAFGGGLCLVYRLCMDDYHRYCFIDDGTLTDSYAIAGKLHTVSPVSKDYPIYQENSRVVTIAETEHFGTMITIEVGALLVGKINNRQVASFHKGEEKGYFEPGGSTIVMLLPPSSVLIDEDIAAESRKGIECTVRYGEKVGTVLPLERR